MTLYVAGMGHNSNGYARVDAIERKRGVIPGCIPPTRHVSIVEQLNINAAVTDYAEKYHLWTSMYIAGEIDYDIWWRLTWNYNKITPVR